MVRVPKSTLMRLLRSMEMHGYLLHMPAERGYVLGTRSATLALRMLVDRAPEAAPTGEPISA